MSALEEAPVLLDGMAMVRRDEERFLGGAAGNLSGKASC